MVCIRMVIYPDFFVTWHSSWIQTTKTNLFKNFFNSWFITNWSQLKTIHGCNGRVFILCRPALFYLILIYKSTLSICLILFTFLIYLFILFVILHFNMVGSPRLITFRYSQLIICGSCLNYIGFRDIWALIYRSCYNNITLLKSSDRSVDRKNKK